MKRKRREGGGAAHKKKAYKLGLHAEIYAAALLRIKGYRILYRRLVTPVGEVDLICRKKGVLVFVEVKARRDAGQFYGAIDTRTRRRICRAAAYVLAGKLSEKLYREPSKSRMENNDAFNKNSLYPAGYPAGVKLCREEPEVRFDAILVSGIWMSHIVAAWECPT